MSTIRKHLLGISLDQIRCEQRGFEVANSAVKAHIEKVGESFVTGYHAALVDSHNESLQQSLDKVENDFRGFAYEGAGMALALLDLLSPWRKNRLGPFVHGAGDAHVYMVYIGTGWAMAKIP